MTKFPHSLVWSHAKNLGTGFDLDTLLAPSGFYEVTDPDSSNPDSGFMFIEVVNSGSTGKVLQKAYFDAGGEPAYRIFDGSSWGNWTYLDLHD